MAFRLSDGFGLLPGQKALSQFQVFLLSQVPGLFQFPAAVGQHRRRVSAIEVDWPQEPQARMQPLVVVMIHDPVDLGARRLVIRLIQLIETFVQCPMEPLDLRVVRRRVRPNLLVRQGGKGVGLLFLSRWAW